MELQVISTGSIGNCYALHAENNVLLLDAGIPAREIIRALPEWREIAGCLITHEHGDHAKAAFDMAKMGIPTYASGGTIDAMGGNGSLTKFNRLESLCAVTVGDFTVLPFEAQHDAAEPLGFVVRYNPTGETAVYATDTYYLKHTFPGVHYWIVECNYIDELMDEQAENDRLSAALRHRLMKSHMSLRHLAETFKANDLSKTRAIVLVHLSDARSDERLMVKCIKEVTGVENVFAAVSGTNIPLEKTPF